MRRNQQGFTLIEIAAVLVIIGLLLGGVFKGRELMNSAKVKNLANDYQGVQAAIATYYDRYRVWPGEDMQASTRFTGAVAADNCVGATCGNGIIDGNWNSTTNANESRLIWRQLRLAGLVPGSGFQQPSHALGGMIGVTGSQALNGVVNVNRIVMQNISGDMANSIDASMDDGFMDLGKMRAANVGTTGTAYTPATLYTVWWQY